MLFLYDEMRLNKYLITYNYVVVMKQVNNCLSLQFNSGTSILMPSGM
jgi:hypothetical protein